MTAPDFDIMTASRSFAIETNNATWHWLESTGRGDHADPIIHTAHASYHHWRHVGTTINQARAASLVANVHAACGNGELARALALECLELVAAAGDDAADWDLAFAHESLARALSALASPDATSQRAKARELGDAIADPADKEVFDNWFNSQL